MTIPYGPHGRRKKKIWLGTTYFSHILDTRGLKFGQHGHRIKLSPHISTNNVLFSLKPIHVPYMGVGRSGWIRGVGLEMGGGVGLVGVAVESSCCWEKYTRNAQSMCEPKSWQFNVSWVVPAMGMKEGQYLKTLTYTTWLCRFTNSLPWMKNMLASPGLAAKGRPKGLTVSTFQFISYELLSWAIKHILVGVLTGVDKRQYDRTQKEVLMRMRYEWHHDTCQGHVTINWM